ncbi:MAG TPA: ABC transporter ATP-binding protein [Candidatus Sulfotelmatobacter sp.]|nr:ABC transporter ATP-binding protein [Candidatus Sulfotelmatobacter sp.]
MAPLLTVRGLSKRFGGFTALRGLDLDVEAGALHAIIGPNGAGKTTLFNLLTGVWEPTEGRISFAGRALGGLPPEARTRLGLCRTFQAVRLFAGLTALENAMLAAQCRGLASEARLAGRARALLAEAGLADRAALPARHLPFGEQRVLELARALATDPTLLLLDEPTAGLNAAEKARLLDLIRALHGRGLTVVFVEHDMQVVMGLAQRITVLNFGEKIAEGDPAAVRRDAAAIEAYLGAPELTS